MRCHLGQTVIPPPGGVSVLGHLGATEVTEETHAATLTYTAETEIQEVGNGTEEEGVGAQDMTMVRLSS